jgi:hypothetical protein
VRELAEVLGPQSPGGGMRHGTGCFQWAACTSSLPAADSVTASNAFPHKSGRVKLGCVSDWPASGSQRRNVRLPGSAHSSALRRKTGLPQLELRWAKVAVGMDSEVCRPLEFAGAVNS